MADERLLRRAAPALLLGFVLAFGSSFGQTFFISLFAGAIRSELDLSHGGFGALYTVATLASAATLLGLGKAADRFDIVRTSAVTLVGLALAAAAMANARSSVVIVFALFGLRLLGQGMMSHLAMTAMGRWFTAGRGRALSLASLGHPMGEALLPPLVAGLLTFVAWRQVWIGMAIAVVAAFVPAVLILGGVVRRRGLDRAATSEGSVDSNTAPSWTRKQVLADKRFYALLPGVLAPPFIVTGVLFHQVHLVTVKSWTLAGFTACYPLFAASQTGVALGLGWLVDRHGAARLMPFYLLPLSAALAVAAIGEAEVTAAVFMTLMGCTAGGAAIVFGALWPELYGVAHLGAIRSLAVSSMVFATALAPGAMGWLIDEGVRLETQLLVLAVYTAVCAAFFGVLRPRLTPRAPPVS